MQLIITITLFLFLASQELKAQIYEVRSNDKVDPTKSDSIEVIVDTYHKPDWKKVDVDFLSSYYQQDGDNSPVTGGIGTEYLTDFTQKILISIPASEKLTLKLDAGYDYYSSASTDNIDNIKSSDSSQDMRTHGNLGFEYRINEQNTFGARIGGSAEYDYLSAQGGINYALSSKRQNTSIGLSAQVFIDKWALYYPKELRGNGALVPTDKRQSYNGALTFTQVLNKRNQIAIMLEGTYMHGLLSTPFHRVYFQESNKAKVESLPSTRLKIPIGVRLNSYLADWLVSRLYYRFYRDDWNITAHTASLELAIKLNRFLWISPYLRYNTQTAADYFSPYKEASVNNEFYSSDYDLAKHTSYSYGIGVSYQPANGMANIKVPFAKQSTLIVKSVDLKVSHYNRSTGLKANIVSIGVGFSF